MGGITLPGVLELTAPEGEGLPVFYTLPHSGRVYPDDFSACQPMGVLRRAEDAYVDRLLETAPEAGITVLKAHFPRAYIDVNRTEDDLDPLLFAPGVVAAPGPKSALGIGLIRRLVTPEYPIYDRTLSLEEAQGRIARCYRPYHAALAETLARLKASFDAVLFIDWHSMKSRGNAATPDGEGACRADFVIGNLHGASCGAGLAEAVSEHFTAAGYTAVLNTPYAGGATLQRYAAPQDGVHGLQIEINRALYLDEEHVELKDSSGQLALVLARLVPVLRDWLAGARAR